MDMGQILASRDGKAFIMALAAYFHGADIEVHSNALNTPKTTHAAIKLGKKIREEWTEQALAPLIEVLVMIMRGWNTHVDQFLAEPDLPSCAGGVYLRTLNAISEIARNRGLRDLPAVEIGPCE